MSDDEYPFNDEFLISDTDRELARKLYPTVFEALDHDELRRLFLTIDEVAKAEKRRSRILGTLAVALVAIALLAASTVPFVHDPVIEKPLAVASAAFGIGGGLLGYFGILFLSSKRRWLVNRFLCERMRQFHFQIIMTSLAMIDEAASSKDWTRYRDYRSTQFDKFRRDVILRANSIFEDVITVPKPQPWLFDGQPPKIPDTPHMCALFQAYDRLRVERQIRFCAYKLSSDSRVFSPLPIVQEARLTAGAFFCVAGILGLHIAIGVNLLTNLSHEWIAPLHLGAIYLAIVALALRTLEEGLQPHREVERYRAYRFGLENIDRRISQSPDTAARYAAMAELEELSFGEMVTFLKGNYEARYIM